MRLDGLPTNGQNGGQNYGSLLGTLNIKCHIIKGIQKGIIILTTTHMSNHQVATAKHFGALNWLLDREFDSLWRPCSSLRAAAGRPLEEKLQRHGFCKELSTPMLPAASRAKVSMALTWTRWETICRGSGCFFMVLAWMPAQERDAWWQK